MAVGSAREVFREFERPRPFYELWQAKEGIPVHRTFYVPDLARVELGWWERFGCHAAFVNLADAHLTTAIVVEVPPGASTRPVKHMFETWVHGVRGRGRTTVSQPGYAPVSVQWGARALFAPPLNTTYQHENPDPREPLRLLMVCNAPLVMSLYHNEPFVFENDFVFDDRFRGEPDFFTDPGRYLGGRIWRTNFVPDALEFALRQWLPRGVGATSYHFSMSGNTIASHLSEFEVGTYKKAHRHGPGAHVVVLKGRGYSLLWEDGKEDQRVRVDWQDGSMFSPPDLWYHQHFNIGPEPARYLALRRGGSPEHRLRIGMPGGTEEGGGQQIEYADEDPAIRELYLRELAAAGVEPRMPAAGVPA